MTQQPFANYQYEIYLAGLGGAVPSLPGDLTQLEALAERHLDPGPFGYVAGSASSERTARANRDAFDLWRLVPRFLRDVSVRDLSTTVLGTPMPAPVLLAPIGVQSIVHADGELATARAASSLGVPFVLSTASSFALEEVAEAAGDGPRWFQLYWPKDQEVGASLLARAKAAGYTALVVTLDTFMLAWRPRDLGGAYLPFLQGVGIANYLSDPAFRSQLAKPPEEDQTAAVLHFLQMFGDPSRTWHDLVWLREQWDGPILLKGVLHSDDARRAVDAGMDGIVVSNHGGRQIDGEIASLDALPAIVEATRGRADVLLDSGVRTGSDVVKALALGAKAVLLGRPYAYGLALDGEAGVRHVVRSLLADVDLTMALSGCTSLADIGPDLMVRAPGGPDRW